MLTIDAPGLTGQAGYLFPSYTLTGTATGASSAQIVMGYNDSSNSLGFVQGPVFYPTGDGVVNFGPIPFHFGAPIGLFTAFGSILYLTDNGSGTADFSHTAILTGLPVFSDLGGTQAVAGVSYGTSELGATYSPDGVVPEPASILLIATGLSVLALFRSRESHRNP